MLCNEVQDVVMLISLQKKLLTTKDMQLSSSNNRIQRLKIDPSFSEYSNVDDINTDLADYADDTTPYAYDLEHDKVIKSLEKNIDKLFDWFSDNFLKANPHKCHLLINTDENVTLKIKNETITNNSNQKLLGILSHNKFDFDEHVISLCRKASQKLNALARVAHYMNLAQRRLIMNAFTFLQFRYCPLDVSQQEAKQSYKQYP